MADFVINKTIKIVTQLNNGNGITGDTALPAISYSIFYPVDNYIPLMTGVLAGPNRQIVQCAATDGFMIDGDLVTQVTATEIVMRANFFYGFSGNYGLQNHFEGTVVIYPTDTPSPEPVPPQPAPEAEMDDFSENITIDAPLFPYIQIQPWPNQTPQDAWLNFIYYDTTTSPAGSLYTLLITPAQAKDRAGMESLALQFLQNEAPFANQYYYNLFNVPQPFSVFPEVYDLLVAAEEFDKYELYILQQLGLEHADEIKAFIANIDKAVIDQVWQNYFALTIMAGYNELFFKQLNKILLVLNFIEKFVATPPTPMPRVEAGFNLLLQAAIVLPGVPAGQKEPVFPLPPYPASTTNAPVPENKSWIEPYAIGQLKLAKYRLLKYQQGEVSQIQNVLKGEKKKILHRSLTNTSEQDMLQNTDTSENGYETREATSELLVEAQKTLAVLTKTIKYDKLNTTYGPPAQAVLDGSYTKTITPGSPASKEDTNNFTSLVVNKTLNRINNTVFKSRAIAKVSEKEEVSSSIFNNTLGTGHFRGIYRWVNKVYRISVHNYGSRFLLQFHLDTPAAEFIKAQETLNNLNLNKPLPPSQNIQNGKGIQSFQDINESNYVALLTYYQVTKIILPPNNIVTAAVTLNAGETERYVTIPDGYQAASAAIIAQMAEGATLKTVNGIIGAKVFSVGSGGQATVVTLQNETGHVCIAVTGNNLPAQPPVQTENFILNVTVTCTVTTKKMNEWQVAVYNEITEAYNAMAAAYNSTITRFAMAGEQTNPLLLNNIEKSCLYKSCMAMLLDIATEKNGADATVTPPLLTVNKQRYIQFADEAFEWDEMTYSFDDQPSRLSYALQGKDDSIRPFLQAGSAVVFLPVRPYYNLQVLYYLSAGVIWLPEYPFTPVNSSDVQTAAHIKKVQNWDEGFREEKHWNITLPTAMQVAQEGNQLPDYSLLK